MRVFRSLSLFVVLFIAWVLLSGYFTPFLLGAGAGSALAVVWLSRRLGIVDEESHPLHMGWRLVSSYWPWLLWEIVKSAWDVTKRIVSPGRFPISPSLVEFAPTQSSDLGLVIHANSITLTPGTIAVEVERGHFLVHALTQGAGDGLAGSDMDRRCTALETP